jgi:hypothetical protein
MESGIKECGTGTTGYLKIQTSIKSESISGSVALKPNTSVDSDEASFTLT